MKCLAILPIIALLGASCSAPHRVTTPVINNAPSVSLTHPSQGLAVPPDTPTESFTFSNHFIGGWTGDAFFRIDNGTNVAYNQLPTYVPVWRISIGANYTRANLLFPLSATSFTTISPTDYIKDYYTNASPSWWTPTLNYPISTAQPLDFSGTFYYFPSSSFYRDGYETGYTEGFDNGQEDAYNSESNRLYQNGQYTGLTIFPRRNYLQKYAEKVLQGQATPENGEFYLIDTNANYTIYIKWNYNSSEMVTTFQTDGNTIIGELDWNYVANGTWRTSWFGKYDPELHYFTSSPKYYATDAPIETSFYPEVYIGSTFTGGDPNLYFSGGGNAYQMGFADGQTRTIQASETYNNVFTIFTPAFSAVARFLNLNIGPFKLWYFFVIPLIITLLILVLRLVKH